MVADTNNKHLCRFSNAVSKCFVIPAPIHGSKKFANAIIQLIKRHKIDIIIPTCEEIFTLAAHHTEITSYCDLLCDPLSKLEPLHNKEKFTQILKQNTLPYPETILLTSPEDVMSTSRIWEKVVYKPVYSRFARQVIICEKNAIHKTKSIIPTKSQPWIAQEFISGRRLCTYGFSKKGKLLAHVTYPIEYSIGEIGSALAFRSIEHEPSFKLVKNLVEALSFTGQISLDLIEKNDGSVVPIECNPRATSGLHLFNITDNFPSAMIDGKQTIFLSKGRKAQLTVPLLLLGGLKSKPKQLLRTLFTGKDVIFRWCDILPALISPALLAYYAWKGFRKGMTITAVSTYDIEWNGEPCE